MIIRKNLVAIGFNFVCLAINNYKKKTRSESQRSESKTGWIGLFRWSLRTSFTYIGPWGGFSTRICGKIVPVSLPRIKSRIEFQFWHCSCQKKGQSFMCMETEIEVNIEFSHNKLTGSKKQKCFDSSMILESKVFQ